MKKIILYLPIIGVTLIFFILALYIFQKNDPNKPPSVLLNKDVPYFQTTSLFDNKKKFSNSDINKNISIINFFASWCIPCKAEHALFFTLKEKFPKVYIVGINHKDNKNDAINFLNNDGNPYDYVGIDPDGKISLNFGVFGLPETFITNGKGKIIYKHIGPLTNKIIKNEIIPLL